MKTSKNQAVMPINVVTMIDEKDPVFKMAEIPEKSDYRKLHSDYRRRWRKIDPEVMFSIVAYTKTTKSCKMELGTLRRNREFPLFSGKVLHGWM